MMKNSTLFIIKKFNCNSVQDPGIRLDSADDELKEMKSAVSVTVPSAQTIRRIMDFARAYDVMETETAGHVEVILN
ncbi:MAG TPA: hypothetical protein ENN90_02935 [Mariniphaga anaerophila]|uniref:Uncharacterized protein n=1 Tax=Mariniphaga anaerophila TaxID=1484053 RepID=A0A831LKX2_9BACT|nr:hypothetical protein [Mariniphaga anaerophila]